MELMEPKPNLKVDDWVEVTRRRFDSPDLILIGKVVESTRDYTVAECRTKDGAVRFTSSDCTFIRRMTQADWAKRKSHRNRGVRL